MTEAWRTMLYHSGTHAISGPMRSWLYVYGPIGDDATRYWMCKELEAFLNGKSRPDWLDEFQRTEDEQMNHVDGSKLIACGPMYDANPPHCDWKTDDSDAAKAERKKLIDMLEKSNG